MTCKDIIVNISQKPKQYNLSIIKNAISSNFVYLSDTPDNYVDDALKILRVKSDESGVEFIDSIDVFNINFATKTTDDLTEGSSNLYDKTVTLSGSDGIVITGNYPNYDISGSGVQSDTYMVKITSNDTTPEFLFNKHISTDSSISFALDNSGADENIDIQVSSSIQDAISLNTAKRTYPQVDETKLAGIEEGANKYILPSDVVQDSDYNHTDNNYTDTEKTKLAGIETGAEVNVQSDWNQSNSSEDDYIKNKPTLSTGDMEKSVYDTNDNGKVDTSDALISHSADVTNPHNVTKTQVGLGNVENVDTTNASNITSGTLPSSVLPPIAITDTFTATSEAEQLALTVQKGDVCVRTDLNKSYINKLGNNTSMTDWQELLTPTDSVLSVNGETGTVILNTDDISDTASNRYTNDTDITRLANTSGTNTGDQDLSGYELLANKDSTVTLGTSDIKYPTQNAVKTYIDNNIANETLQSVTDRGASTTNIISAPGIYYGSSVRTISDFGSAGRIISMGGSTRELRYINGNGDGTINLNYGYNPYFYIRGYIQALGTITGSNLSGTNTGDQDAIDVETDTTNFTGVLSSSDTDVQKALETLDETNLQKVIDVNNDTTKSIDLIDTNIEDQQNSSFDSAEPSTGGWTITGDWIVSGNGEASIDSGTTSDLTSTYTPTAGKLYKLKLNLNLESGIPFVTITFGGEEIKRYTSTGTYTEELYFIPSNTDKLNINFAAMWGVTSKVHIYDIEITEQKDVGYNTLESLYKSGEIKGNVIFLNTDEIKFKDEALTSNIVPKTTQDVDLGSSSNVFNNAYANSIFTKTIIRSGDPGTNILFGSYGTTGRIQFSAGGTNMFYFDNNGGVTFNPGGDTNVDFTILTKIKHPLFLADAGDSSILMDTVKLLLKSLPTSEPSTVGQVWNDSGTLKIKT